MSLLWASLSPFKKPWVKRTIVQSTPLISRVRRQISRSGANWHMQRELCTSKTLMAVLLRERTDFQGLPHLGDRVSEGGDRTCTSLLK